MRNLTGVSRAHGHHSVRGERDLDHLCAKHNLHDEVRSHLQCVLSQKHGGECPILQRIEVWHQLPNDYLAYKESFDLRFNVFEDSMKRTQVSDRSQHQAKTDKGNKKGGPQYTGPPQYI